MLVLCWEKRKRADPTSVISKSGRMSREEEITFQSTEFISDSW